MALPLFDNGARKKRDQMLAIDLGSRTTKAVVVQRRGNDFVLCAFALLDAPIYDKTLSLELLTEHLRTVTQSLGSKVKLTTLAVGVNDSLVRHVDMPKIPMEEMRQVLKFNSKNYLQQDLTGHVFDCCVLTRQGAAGSAEAPKSAAAAQRQKVLVAGAKKQLVDDFIEASKAVGLVADHVIPSLVCPANSFEMAMPEVYSREAVALVDVGFKSSFISLLQEGEFILGRVVTLGGDRLTAGLAENMNISYAEAEGIKVGMAQEVQPQMEALVTPLGRELRASIDFFEHQQDRPVSRVYVSGASANSEYVLQALQNELMVECRTWNPATSLQLALPEDKAAQMPQIASQLSVALGAAFAAF